MGDKILEMKNITVSFPGVLALDHARFSLEQGETVMDARCYLQGRVIDVILRTRVMVQVIVDGGLQEEIDGLLTPDIEAQVEAEFGDQVVVVSQTRGITADVIDAEPSEEPRFEETTSCSGLVK